MLILLFGVLSNLRVKRTHELNVIALTFTQKQRFGGLGALPWMRACDKICVLDWKVSVHLQNYTSSYFGRLIVVVVDLRTSDISRKENGF